MEEQRQIAAEAKHDRRESLLSATALTSFQREHFRRYRPRSGGKPSMLKPITDSSQHQELCIECTFPVEAEGK